MLPEETILAVFPSSVKCVKTTLRPMTLYHIVAMEALKIPFDNVTKENAIITAWLLSLKPQELPRIVGGGSCNLHSTAMKRWAQKYSVGKDAAYASVAETLRLGFLTFVPRANGGNTEVQLKLRGYGWCLELAESLMSRYHISLEDALSMPLCRLFALLAVGNAANGCGGGPDYYERIDILNIKRARVEALKNMLKATEGKGKDSAPEK